jgi:glycogen synthase
MRIALVAAEYSYPNNGGGIGTYMHTLARTLTQLGHEVMIIAEALGQECTYEEEQGLYVHCVGHRHALSWALFGPFKTHLGHSVSLFEFSLRVREVLLSLHEEKKIDVVHFADWGADGFAFHMVSQIPYTVTLQGPNFWYRKNNALPLTWDQWLVEQMERQMIIRASAITYPSNGIIQKVITEYRNTKISKKAFKVNNPLDTGLFHPVEPIARPDPQRLVVTFAGRLQYRKGIQTLLAAIPKVLEQVPGVTFRLIGRDMPNAIQGMPVKDYVKTYMQDSAKAIEITGPVNRRDLPAYYAGSDLVIVPSLEETFGYVCAEAMACGACVIASDIQAFQQLVENDKTGYLFPVGNEEALSDRIIYLLQNPAVREGMASSAARKMPELAGAEQVTKEMLAVWALIQKSR